MQDHEDNTAPESCGCCKAQIAEILARLEKLEREALTLEKLLEMEPAKISQAL